MEGRKHTRFAVQLPVSFRGDQLSHEGTILNLSAEGCAITSESVAVARSISTADDATPGARGAGPGRSGRGPVVFCDEVRC